MMNRRFSNDFSNFPQRRSNGLFGIFKFLFIIGVLIIVAGFVFKTSYKFNTEIVYNYKVIKLQQLNMIEGDNSNISTNIRYLVVTDKETFICESSIINNKFNNSDIFWRLKEDSTYNFKVEGLGKTVLTDYRNILEVVK